MTDSGGTDDEALSWAGDEPTAATRAAETSPDADGDAGGSSLGALALLALSVFAGVFLLYAAGWLAAATRNPVSLPNPLPQTLYLLGMALSVLSGPAWFAAVLLAERSLPRRLVALLIGALLLLPWPFLLAR